MYQIAPQCRLGCHIAHHSAVHGLIRAGLRVHSYLQTFAYNVGLGEWSDQTRREQIVASMKATLCSNTGPADDPIFRACLPFMERCSPADGAWTTASEQEMYNSLKDGPIWDESETRLTNNKFFGYIYRFKMREASGEHKCHTM